MRQVEAGGKANLRMTTMQAVHACLRDCFSGRLVTEAADTAPFLTDFRNRRTSQALAVAQSVTQLPHHWHPSN